MLSLGSNGHAWLCIMCKAIQAKIDPDGHHHDNVAVLQLFAAGEDWALEKKIPIPEGDHAQAYIASRDSSSEPVIPEFMRQFCAETTGTKTDVVLTLVADTAAHLDSQEPKAEEALIEVVVASLAKPPRETYRMPRHGRATMR